MQTNANVFTVYSALLFKTCSPMLTVASYTNTVLTVLLAFHKENIITPKVLHLAVLIGSAFRPAYVVFYLPCTLSTRPVTGLI